MASHPGTGGVPLLRSAVGRLVGAFVVAASLAVIIGVVLLRSHERSMVEREFGTRLQGIAATAAPYVSASDLAALRTNADASKPEFARVRKVLETAQAHNGLEQDQVYIVRPGDAAGAYPFVAMLQPTTFIGDDYRPPPQVQEAYTELLSTAKPGRTPLFEDEHGSFISGLAPVVDSSGKAVAILHADARADAYLAEVDEAAGRFSMGALLLLLLVSLIGWLSHRWMNAKVAMLLRGTQAIMDEEYDFRLSMTGKDEMAHIGDALDRSMERLKERFEMLKFLPKHTADMIEEQSRSGTVNLDVARLVNVVVLESDIRGFTKLSERMTPSEVIAMLNEYVRLQAEIIVELGGSIDKYMGDAVLAIFEGPERHARALRASMEIQVEVARRNENPEFGQPVKIGIGLASGEVVMGNMGSESRMEYTVIGSTVNLGARLCTAAEAGEIVLTEVLGEQVVAEGLELGGECEIEMIEAKGFADPIRCIRLKESETA